MNKYICIIVETQEFQMLMNKWCLRRTKSLIADQLPTKGKMCVTWIPFCMIGKSVYEKRENAGCYS